MRRWLLTILTAVLLLVKPASAAVLYVSTTGSDAHSGGSWSDAKQTIPAALTIANPGDQVWVAGGTYVGSFTLRKDVAVYGGFAGTETDLSQRNVAVNPTVLDGNATVRIVTVNADATPATVLDGFYLRNGAANSSNRAAYIFCTGNPTISQCTFASVVSIDGFWDAVQLQSSAGPHFLYCIFNTRGAAIDGTAGSPYIEHCAFDNCYISLYGISLIENCTFQNWVDGPAIAVSYSLTDPNGVSVVRDVQISNCGEGISLYNNAVDVANCGIIGCQYAGISGTATNLSVVNCLIGGNGKPRQPGDVTGGIWVGADSLTVSQCTFLNNTGTGIMARTGRSGATNLRIIDSLFVGNHSAEDGGAIQALGTGIIANNTFSDNQGAVTGVALYSSADYGLTFANNVVAYNSQGISGRSTPALLSHNCFFGNTGGDYSNIAPGATDLHVDPQFVNRSSGDFHLAPTSPAIDAGDDTVVQAGDLDLDFRTRRQGSHVDIGAYETASALSANLSVQVAALPTSVLAGSQITYTFTVRNAGPADATGASLTDTLPASLHLVSAASSQGSCIASGNSVSCDLGTLSSGAQATVTIVAQAPADGGGSIQNTASVSSAVPDVDLSDNSASTTTAVVAAANLSVTHQASAASVAVGGSLTYLTTVTNAGPSSASNVVVDITLPAGVTLNSAISSQGICAVVPSGLHCALGTLSTNGTSTITVVITPGSSAPASLVSTATVAATETDPNPSNNSATASPTLSAAADLALTGTIARYVQAGDTLSYTLTVTNNGPSPTTSVNVTNNLPAHATFVSVAPSAGTFAQQNGQLQWTILTLANGATATLTVVVRTATDQTLSWSTDASVTAGQSDPVSGNNSLSLTAQRCASDITATVKVKKGALTFSRAKQHWLQKVTLTAAKKQTLPASLSLVVAQLSQNAVLKNGNGVTQCAQPVSSPYVNVPGAARPARTATVTLEFTRADKNPVTYTAKVLAGSGVR